MGNRKIPAAPDPEPVTVEQLQAALDETIDNLATVATDYNDRHTRADKRIRLRRQIRDYAEVVSGLSGLLRQANNPTIGSRIEYANNPKQEDH